MQWRGVSVFWLVCCCGCKTPVAGKRKAADQKQRDPPKRGCKGRFVSLVTTVAAVAQTNNAVASPVAVIPANTQLHEGSTPSDDDEELSYSNINTHGGK